MMSKTIHAIANAYVYAFILNEACGHSIHVAFLIHARELIW